VIRRLAPIHRPSPSFTSAPEVRVLSSAGVTRHQRSYDPVRLPPAPSPCGDVEAATLVLSGYPPITRSTFPTCRAHYPDGPEQVHVSVASLLHSGLPRFSGGSASMTSLSRPAQASHTLRPAGLLNRPRRPSSRGFDPPSYPNEPLVSYQVLPTTSWVDPSSTGEPRRWGALRNPVAMVNGNRTMARPVVLSITNSYNLSSPTRNGAHRHTGRPRQCNLESLHGHCDSLPHHERCR
jgi:hypothetical protein